jgi:hypothetical protein
MVTKLELFKTAYCPIFGKFVEIKQVLYDDAGQAVIFARLQDSEEIVTLRESQLENYVL